MHKGGLPFTKINATPNTLGKGSLNVIPTEHTQTQPENPVAELF
jgi:hypothetical protein